MFHNKVKTYFDEACLADDEAFYAIKDYIQNVNDSLDYTKSDEELGEEVYNILLSEEYQSLLRNQQKAINDLKEIYGMMSNRQKRKAYTKFHEIMDRDTNQKSYEPE